MSDRPIIDMDSAPRLAAHMRLKFDTTRASYTIQAPERVFLLDDVAHAIVTRCDGRARLADIVGELCRLYGDAPAEEVGADVLGVVQDFVDKGVMAL